MSRDELKRLLYLELLELQREKSRRLRIRRSSQDYKADPAAWEDLKRVLGYTPPPFE